MAVAGIKRPKANLADLFPNGSTTLSLSSQWAKARLLSTGAGWEVIG